MFIPELLKYRPEYPVASGGDDTEVWFNIDDKGFQKRMEVLNNTIKDISTTVEISANIIHFK